MKALSPPERKLLAKEIAQELHPYLTALTGNVMDLEEARRMLGCPSTDAVRKLCERGRLPCHRFNRKYYFFDSEIKTFLMGRNGHEDD